MSNEKCAQIQHDAAVNVGNSGGPLFWDKNGRHYWVGINTWTVWKFLAEGINFAIVADEAVDADYVWSEANTQGARRLIEKLFRNAAAFKDAKGRGQAFRPAE